MNIDPERLVIVWLTPLGKTEYNLFNNVCMQKIIGFQNETNEWYQNKTKNAKTCQRQVEALRWWDK